MAYQSRDNTANQLYTAGMGIAGIMGNLEQQKQTELRTEEMKRRTDIDERRFELQEIESVNQEMFDNQVKLHMKGLMGQTPGQAYKPDITNPEFDPKAYAAAQMKSTQVVLQDQQVARGHHAAVANEHAAGQKAVANHVNAAKAATEGTQPDLTTGFKHIEEAYEGFYDGNDLIIHRASPHEKGPQAKNSYTIKGPNSSETFEFNSETEMFSDLMAKAEVGLDPVAFGDAQNQARANINADNVRVAGEGIWSMSQDGKVNGVQHNGFYNNVTKKREGATYTIYDGVQPGRHISEEEWNKLGMQRTGGPAATAGANKRATEAKSKGSGAKDNRSPTEKLVDLHVDIKGGTRKQALQEVTDNKNLGDKLKAYNEVMESSQLYADDPDDADKIHELRSRMGLLEFFGVGNDNADQGGGGSVTEEAVVASLNKQFPKSKEGAVKYLGQEKFTFKGGKWVRG